MSLLSQAGLDSILGVDLPPSAPTAVASAGPQSLTARRVAAACDALAHEAIFTAIEAESGRVRRRDWPALLELVAEARRALADFRRA